MEKLLRNAEVFRNGEVSHLLEEVKSKSNTQ